MIYPFKKPKNFIFCFTFLLFISLGIIFEINALTTTPYTKSWVANAGINAIAQGSDGFTYLGGVFTQIGPYTGGGVPINITDGKMLATFPKVNGSVSTIISDGNGGWYLGGEFDRVGEFERKGLVHLLADLSVDQTWNPPIDGNVYSLLLTGNTLYVGGEFKFVLGGKNFENLVRFQNQVLDQTWIPTGNLIVYALARKDNLIYSGGHGYLINKDGMGRVIDVTESLGAYPINGGGLFDITWKPKPNFAVYTITAHDHFLYVGGRFTTVGGKDFPRLARFDFNNSLKLDEAWKPNPQANSSEVRVSLVIDHFLYVAGDFESIGGKDIPSLVRLDLNKNAAVDDSWQPKPIIQYSVSRWVGALAVQGNFLYAGGWFGSIGEKDIPYLARFDLSNKGAIDASWAPNPSQRVNALAIDGNSLYVGGLFSSMNSERNIHLARLKPDGTLDTTWKLIADERVNSLISHNNFLYVGGLFQKIGTTPSPLLARLDLSKNGELDTTWIPNLKGNLIKRIYTLLLHDNFLYAGGTFDSVFDQPATNLVRFNLSQNGQFDAGWMPEIKGEGLGLGVGVYSLAVQSNTLYASGLFNKVKGKDISHLVRFDLSQISGEPDATWIPTPNKQVTSIAVNDPFLYIGGEFTAVGARGDIQYLARLNLSKNGELDTSWIQKLKPVDKPESTWITSLAMSGNILYAAGRFSAVNDQNIPYLVRFQPDGSLDSKWNTRVIDTYAGIHSLVIGNGSLYIDGNLFSVGSIFSPLFSEIRAPIQFAKREEQGDRKAKKVEIEVILDEPNSANQVTVDYEVTGGSAKKGEEYQLENSTLTLRPGDAHGFISLEILGNDKRENSTIEISLLNPTEAFLGKNDRFTYTLLASEGNSTPPNGNGDKAEAPREVEGGGGCGCSLHATPLNWSPAMLWILYFALLGFKRFKRN